MRVVVVGASGNVGTSVVRALGADDRVTEITGVVRRLPDWTAAKTTWVSADVAADPLEPIFAGAAAVIHLAWLIQPSRDEAELARVNVHGSQRVFEAAAASGAGALVYASSVGAYSRGPKDRAVDESWPTDGISTSFYSRHKAATERQLDKVERANPRLRVVRLRPGLIFKHDAGTQIRRYFVGPFLPSALVRPDLIPVVPRTPGLRFQALHTDDVAEAYRLAALEDRARGAYNVAAEPVLDTDELADALGARPVPVPARVLRAAATVSWKARLQPTPPGWVDLGLGVPIMDTGRIRRELGWSERVSARDALLELIAGIRESGGKATPPLDPKSSGPLRIRELLTGIGKRNP
ncbi:MAG TPA: NAD-dependent epimerase/dehydratase family protein [Solirubrobacteraceae bacterium]|jgi:nucleoside-diphosphate-sugar epimerase